MTLTRSALALAILGCVAALAAGCGSSGSSSSTTTSASSISKADFVSQANAICAKGNKATNADNAKLKSVPQSQAEAVISKTFVPDIQQQIDAIRALGAPAGDEATVSNMLDLAQSDLDKLKANPELLGQQDLFTNFATVAHPYGLTECAKGS